MNPAQAATFGKWSLGMPKWFTHATGPADDAEVGYHLGDGQPYYRLMTGAWL